MQEHSQTVLIVGINLFILYFTDKNTVPVLVKCIPPLLLYIYIPCSIVSIMINAVCFTLMVVFMW